MRWPVASGTLRRRGSAGTADRRGAASAAAGAIAAALGAIEEASWSVAALVAWDAAATVFIAWVWLTVVTAGEGTTARMARSEDSRPAAEAMVVGAGLASLLAVAFTLVRAGHTTGTDRGLLMALAVASVVLGWISVHTVYLLRYARLYYGAPVGGIDFHGDHPDYLDFAYLALTIGMTFQVSDTDLVARRVRRTAVHHALLSYLFGTVVVAITINVVAGLLGR
jgi:uncharacterized membrane protein